MQEPRDAYSYQTQLSLATSEETQSHKEFQSVAWRKDKGSFSLLVELLQSQLEAKHQ
jgi:hypothetical protein